MVNVIGSNGQKITIKENQLKEVCIKCKANQLFNCLTTLVKKEIERLGYCQCDTLIEQTQV